MELDLIMLQLEGPQLLFQLLVRLLLLANSLLLSHKVLAEGVRLGLFSDDSLSQE